MWTRVLGDFTFALTDFTNAHACQIHVFMQHSLYSAPLDLPSTCHTGCVVLLHNHCIRLATCRSNVAISNSWQRYLDHLAGKHISLAIHHELLHLQDLERQLLSAGSKPAGVSLRGWHCQALVTPFRVMPQHHCSPQPSSSLLSRVQPRAEPSIGACIS